MKVLRIEEAVTGAKSMMSEIARTQGGDSGKRPLWRPEIMRFQWALKLSASLAMPWRRTSPKVGGSEGVSST